MAHYIDKSVLVAEIERLKADALQKKSQCKRSGLERIMHQIGAYNKILSLINTLEVKDVKEEPVSEDLDFQTFADEMTNVYNLPSQETKNTEEEPLKWEYTIARHFAKWQKQQDQSTIELAEDHAALAGMEKMKEQMMKDAVDMVVGYWMPNGLMLAIDESENCYNIDDGDKVKVIVIKED